MTRDEIYALIDAERARQERLHPGRTCASRINLCCKLGILLEEVGEIAKALNESDIRGAREELVQVAAVCVAWLESL